jgi:hypothetical protein
VVGARERRVEPFRTGDLAEIGVVASAASDALDRHAEGARPARRLATDRAGSDDHEVLACQERAMTAVHPRAAGLVDDGALEPGRERGDRGDHPFRDRHVEDAARVRDDDVAIGERREEQPVHAVARRLDPPKARRAVQRVLDPSSRRPPEEDRVRLRDLVRGRVGTGHEAEVRDIAGGVDPRGWLVGRGPEHGNHGPRHSGFRPLNPPCSAW